MEKNKQIEIDNLDKKILNTLIDNSRLSYRQIAKKLEISPVTVMKRVKKLEKLEVIKKYTINIDYEKLGYEIPIVMDVRIKKGSGLEAGKKIAQNPNISAVYDITGAFDLTVVGRFKSRKQLDNLVKTLPKDKLIERTYTRLIINTIKEENTKV